MKNKLINGTIDILIRAAKTFIAAFIATLETCECLSGVNWKYALDTAALAGLLTILINVDKVIPDHYKRKRNETKKKSTKCNK